MSDQRSRIGLWWGRFFVSVVVGGYGVSLGVTSRSLCPVTLFRNYAYRGLL